MLTLTLRMLSGGKRRKARTNAFEATRPAPGDPRLKRADLIFRLKAWPQLPESGRTAEIYRMLSIMSNQPVNRRWLLERFQLAPRQLDTLMAQLVQEGAVEVIDPALFAGREPARA